MKYDNEAKLFQNFAMISNTRKFTFSQKPVYITPAAIRHYNDNQISDISSHSGREACQEYNNSNIKIYFDFGYYTLITPFRFTWDSTEQDFIIHTNRLQQVNNKMSILPLPLLKVDSADFMWLSSPHHVYSNCDIRSAKDSSVSGCPCALLL